MKRQCKKGNITSMNARFLYRAGSLLLFSVTLWLPAPAASNASAALAPEAAAVARSFLFAFTRNDREAIREMVPESLGLRYGPCPFAQMPVLKNPRVDNRVGAIEFTGAMTDPGLPNKGMVVLRFYEQDGEIKWLVRQIYWYPRLPPNADLPDRSPTEADRKQEPDAVAAATAFLQAWRAGDYQKMDALTFRWWEVERRPPKWVKMTGADLSVRPTTLNGTRVDFIAKLRLGGILPKRVQGNLWLVEEDGCWRVRPVTFAFWF